MQNEQRWRIATWIAVAVWVLLAFRLMIADVWDETNGMLFFCDAAIPLAAKVHFVLTQSLGFWRPLATLIAAVFMHFIPFDLAWRVLRVVNMLMMCGSFWLLSDAADRWTGVRSERRRFLFAIALLFSGSGVIAAGWYADIFDATALVLIAGGLNLLARDRTGRPIAAGGTPALLGGLLLGIAFFAKETAVLALPFLVILLAAGKISFRNSLRAAIPAVILGGVYFAIRARIVPFGSASDVHGFTRGEFLPTLLNLSATFWIETMKRRLLIVGLGFLAFSLAMLRRPRVIALTALFIVGCAIIYWGMFLQYQSAVVSHLDFIGRLYLVPAALFLLLLMLEAKDVAIAVLLIPILFGGIQTYRDHTRFQRVYKQIYRMKPVVVHFPEKPLADKVRGVDIGDHPDAKVVIDAVRAKLIRR